MDSRARARMSVRLVTCALALAVGAGAARAGSDDKGNIVATVKTTKSRTEMSAFLVKSAEAAADKRDWKRAIPLYAAVVVARGPASAEARKLASLWTLAGQRDEAIKVLREFMARPTTRRR